MALNKDKIFKAADKHIRNNRIDKAINEYETWLKENPRDWNTIRQVGDLYSRVGRNDEAIKKYALVADHFRRDGFNVRAIATHKMILRLDSQNESAMRNLAELQAEEGLLMEAKSHFQTLVELYNKQGHKRRAAEVFKKLAEIDPQDVKIRYKYADFLGKQGKADEAAREYVSIADQFIGQGLVDEAVKILEQGRALSTSDPALKMKLAQALTLQGNHSQAVRMLEEVSNAHPNDPGMLGRLGESYLASGNTADAEKTFQKLHEVEPENPENTVRLADLRIVQAQFDAALEQLTPLVNEHVADNEGGKASELLQKVLAKDPYHVKTLLKLAEVHTILKQDSARAAAYDGLCEAYKHIGDIEKAVQVAEQLVELDPENSQHKDRLNFLKSKLGGPATAPPPSSAPSSPPRPAPIADARSLHMQLDEDLPEFGAIGEVDSAVLMSESVEEELTLDEPASTGASAGPVDLGDVIELTDEDEENIKEKLTEAEVFVRYGLVDKAIAQLLDVLESFRYNTDSREKLVEIYRDQGMTREASEQLIQLAQVYDKLGRHDEGASTREEAARLNPSLAARAASADLAAQEELELTLAPETDSDLGDVGIELDAPQVSSEVALSAAPDEAASIEEEVDVVRDDVGLDIEEPLDVSPEIDLSLGESEIDAGIEAQDEIPVETDLGDDAGPASSHIDLSGVSDAGELDAGKPEVSLGDIEDMDSADNVSIGVDDDETIPDFAEPDEDAGDDTALDLGDAASSDEIEIDLDASSDEIPFEMRASEKVEAEEPMAAPESEDQVDISFGADATAASVAPTSESDVDTSDPGEQREEFSEAIDDEEFSVDMAAALDEVVSADFARSADEASVEDIQIDIPGADDLLTDEVDVEIPEIAGPPEPPAQTPAPVPDAVASAPTSTAAAPPSGLDPELPELEEVDEYIALGLYEDARDTLRELLKQHPDQENVISKLEELGFSVEQLQEEADSVPAPLAFEAPVLKRASDEIPVGVVEDDDPLPTASPEPERELVDDTELADEEKIGIEALVHVPQPEPVRVSASADEQFVDLASELSDEIFGTQIAVDEDEAEPEGPLTDPGLDQIFKEFRKGVEKQLGTEDYDTRYNLGIAYKEMGLLDEAIAEFQLAAKDEVRSLECCSMLGLCFMEKGMPDIAIKWFSKGLEIPGRRDEEYHGLKYDLGVAYDAAGQRDRARDLYTEIYKENARFRDVKDRLT